MKIGTKILIGLTVLIGIGTFVQGAVRVVLEGNAQREALKVLAANTINRIANSLASPIWNFDTLQIETVARLELADRNILAVELYDNMGGLTSFFVWQEGELVDFALGEEQLRTDTAANAIFSVTSDLKYQDNLLGKVVVHMTDIVLYEELRQYLISVSIFALFYAIALFFVISFMLRRIVVNPIMELTKVVGSFSEENLTVRSGYSSLDEIGTLSTSYNKMLDTIQEYTEALEFKVQKRTQELASANEVLRRQKDEMDRNLKMAQRIQLNLIPSESTYPKRDELSFGSLYSAMDAIGGDIFDIIRAGRSCYGLLMADVSGHGVPAALVTTMAKVSFNSQAQTYGVKPSEVCGRVNADILRLLGSDFSHYLTAFFGILDMENHTFSWCNCGHHPAILLRGEKIIRLGRPGPFIGFVETAEFMDETINLEKGDRIIFFTDGIVEARNAKGEMFDVDRLLKHCADKKGEGTGVFVKTLLHELKLFCGNERQDDDRAVLVVDYYKSFDTSDSTKPEIDIKTGQLFKSEKREIKAYLREAAALVRERRYNEALNIASDLYDVHPDNVLVITHYAHILYKMGEFKRALSILKGAYDRMITDKTIVTYMSKIEERIKQLG